MNRTSLARTLLSTACAVTTLHCGNGAGTSGATSGSGGSSSSATVGASSSGAGGGGGAASSSNSSSSSSGSGDPCAGRLLCDDFEGDALGAAPKAKAAWKVATNMGKVVIDGAHAHSGSRAVKVSTQAGQYKQALFYFDGGPVFPVAGNVVHGRMMIYMDQTASDGVHWTMAAGQGPLAGHPGVTSIYRYGGMHMGKMMANYETSGAKTDCWDNSQTVMPTKKWACMEWRFDGPNNEMRFWLDGAEVADLHMKDQGMGCINHDLQDKWLAPTFQRMSFGWESYQQDAARDAWIDDVIIDDKPIGCPP